MSQAVVQILRADGGCEEHTVGRHILMRWIERMIGATLVDVVNLRDGRVLIVDDEGYEIEQVESLREGVLHVENRPVRARKPVNAAATALYHAICKPGTTHQIVGDAAVAWDADFDTDNAEGA